MMKAQDIMEREVVTVKEHDRLEEAAKVLLDNKISGVPVVNNDQRVVGIITEGDLIYQAKKLRVPAFMEILGGVFYFDDPGKIEQDLRKMVAVRVSEVMSSDIISVEEDTPVEDIATLMVEKGINRVPVINKDMKLVGIISRQDLVRAIHNRNKD